MGLFLCWFSKKPPAAADGEPPPALPDQDLDQSIAAIAARRGEPAMRDEARLFPRRYGPEVIPELTRRFDVIIAPPPSFSAREPSACAWIACWQAALYEIIYQYHEHAVPAFREMACDGHNGTAVVRLRRLAAEGVDREDIIADLRHLMPDLPFAVRCDIAAELLWWARTEPALAGVVEDLRQAPAFEQALVEVRQFGDECDGPPDRVPNPPRGVAGRRALLAAIAIALGIGVGVAVVGATGVWAAVWVGALAAAFSAAVFFIVEVAVFNRM